MFSCRMDMAQTASVAVQRAGQFEVSCSESRISYSMREGTASAQVARVFSALTGLLGLKTALEVGGAAMAARRLSVVSGVNVWVSRNAQVCPGMPRNASESLLHSDRRQSLDSVVMKDRGVTIS